MISNERLFAQVQEKTKDPLLPVAARHYFVTSVSWKGHYKRLRLEPGKCYLNVPLSASVSQGDQIVVSNETVAIVCKHGKAALLPIYVARETLHFGDLEVDVVIKEITETDELLAN